MITPWNRVAMIISVMEIAEVRLSNVWIDLTLRPQYRVDVFHFDGVCVSSRPRCTLKCTGVCYRVAGQSRSSVDGRSIVAYLCWVIAGSRRRDKATAWGDAD